MAKTTERDRVQEKLVNLLFSLNTEKMQTLLEVLVAGLILSNVWDGKLKDQNPQLRN